MNSKIHSKIHVSKTDILEKLLHTCMCPKCVESIFLIFKRILLTLNMFLMILITMVYFENLK